MSTTTTIRARRWATGVTLAICLGVGATAVPATAVSATPARATTQADPGSQAELGAYVQAVYELLLGRPAEPAGEDYWVALLEQGTPRDRVATAITNSDEFRTVLLASHYQYFLLRPIDPAGLQYFLALMRMGLTIEDIDVILMASDEYFLRFAEGDPDFFVAVVYFDLLSREPDPAGWDYWSMFLGSNPSAGERGLVAAGIVYSTEALLPVVDSYFQFVLGRPSDPAGALFWAHQIQAGYRDEAIIGFIVGSQEFFDLVT
jgi:hypothetical protein